jgi:ABC-type Fe3+ transport system permease subunit
MSKKTIKISLITGSLALIILPWASVFVAYKIAETYDCRVDTAGVHPCLVGNRDLGKLLNTMGMMGFVGMMTSPLGIAVLAAVLSGKKAKGPQ